MGINSNLIKSETDIEMLLDNEDDVKGFMASQRKKVNDECNNMLVIRHF